jgi:hypothetical protein
MNSMSMIWSVVGAFNGEFFFALNTALMSYCIGAP